MKRVLLTTSCLLVAGALAVGLPGDAAFAAKKKAGASRPKGKGTPAAPAPSHEPTPAPAPEPAPAEPAPEAQAPAPAPTPQPTPPPQPATPPPSASRGNVDLEGLSAEYNALKDDLFRSRAKAELLGAALYKTRLLATFEYKAQRAWPLKRVTLKLDEQPVAALDAPNAADNAVKLYDGFAVPGRHTLTLRVECAATGESRIAYTAEDSFTFDFDDGKLAKVEFSVDESGDGPAPLAKKKAGDFDVRVYARVRSEKIVEAKK